MERPSLIPLGPVAPATATLPIISLDDLIDPPAIGNALGAYQTARIGEARAVSDLRALGVETGLLEKMIARRRAQHERRKW